MVSRARFAVPIALLLALAGCAGVGLGGPGTPPAGVPDPHNASQVPETGNYRVHWVVSANRSGSALPEDVNETVWVGHADGEEIQLVVQRGDRDQPTTTYATRNRKYTRTGLDDAAVTYRFDADGVYIVVPPNPPKGSVGSVLTLATFEYDGTVTRDGRTRHRFVADESRADEIQDYEATVLVTADGWVSHAEGSYVDADSNQRITFEWSVETDVGLPERPGWTDRVPNVTLTLAEDGAYAVLENVGDTPLAANRTLVVRVAVGEQTETREVTLSESLDPGEHLYVSAAETDDGLEVRLSESAPESEGVVIDVASLITTDQRSPRVVAETDQRSEE